MTIYTNNNGEKKENTSDLKSPMVVTEDVPDLQFKKTIDDTAILLPPITATLIAQRRRATRTRTLAQLCLLLTAIFVLALGVMTGIYLYKHFSREVYSGWCSVGNHDDTFEFQEKVETDRQRYERIDVPAINDFREATILHDFDRNYTAIIDKVSDRCYVMPLNYSLVKPPKDFWDLISKIQSGYYLPDEEMVRENYQVLEPELSDLTPFGFYIWRECRYLDTYRMQRIHDTATSMVKRAACHSDNYRANAGKTVQYNIMGC